MGKEIHGLHRTVGEKRTLVFGPHHFGRSAKSLFYIAVTAHHLRLSFVQQLGEQTVMVICAFHVPIRTRLAFIIGQVDRPTIATLLLKLTTSMIPGIAFASSASKLFSFIPKGAR